MRRLKKFFTNCDDFGLSAEDKRALYQGRWADTQSSVVVLSVPFGKGWSPKKASFPSAQALRQVLDVYLASSP